MKIILVLLALCVILFNIVYSQWEKLNNEFSNTTIISLETKDNLIFSGTNGKGIYLSSDQGLNWQSIKNGINNSIITFILPIDNFLFVGTWGDGIYLSSNNGTDWVRKNDGFMMEYVNSISFNNNVLFLGTLNGLIFSTDFGDYWDKKNLKFNNISINSFDTRNDTIIFTSHGSGVYLSPDNGMTWFPRNNGLTNTYVRSIKFCNDNLIIANFAAGGLYLSNDFGNTWVLKNKGLEDKFCNTILIKDSIIFVGTNDGVYFSRDNCENWIKFNKGIESILIEKLTPTDEYLFAGTFNNGIYRIKLTELPTNIYDKEYYSDINISPNPAREYIFIIHNVETGLRPISTNEINIYNLLGECVLSVETQHSVSLQWIDISSLPLGIYHVRLADWVGRFVKIE